MIIYANEIKHANHRENSVLGAVKQVLENIEAGNVIEIEAVYDATGKRMQFQAVRMVISKVFLENGRKYMTRINELGVLSVWVF